MGSAVVKPLSKKRGRTKSSDPGESSRLGNQNVNIAKGNQEANVGIGEGTKSIQVDSIADPVTNVCKSVSEKPYQVAGRQKPAVSSPSGDKVVPCYDSDEEPYPIQKANYSGSSTNESVDQKAQNAGEKDRGDSKGKVTFEPHLPLAERSHPPLTSDHQRFRRFSSLFRTGSGVSCFRKSGHSLKSVHTGEGDQKVKTGSTGASPEPEAILEVELQPANSDEKDVCCDARTPSPQYDKLEDLDIINPSPKSVDINLNQKSVDYNLSQKPVDINLSQKSVDINLSPKSVDHPSEGQQETLSIVPCSQEIQEDSAEDIDMLVIGQEMKLCGYEQDEHRAPEIDETTDTPTEIEDPAFDDRSFEIEAYDELEENKDSLEIKEHTDPVLDTETHTNRYRSVPLSTSSSKESNGEQSCDERDSSPLKCLNRTQDFKDVRYSNQVSASGSECCVNPSVHSVNAYEDLADGCGGSGGVIKERSPAPSPCDTAQPFNDIVHTEMPPADSDVLNCSGVYEEKEFSLLNGSVPANPTLKNTWSEEMQDFRNRLKAALEENFMNGVNSGYSLKTLERFSECDLRNMSPIKEEAIGCESLCTCEQPQRETHRSSSAKSTRANQDLNEEGQPLHSQIFYSSSRNSLHLSDSRLKQSTPPPCPVTTCKSNVSTVSQPELRCNPISYSRSPTALQFVSSKEKLNPSDQRSEPETPVHQITETASNISVNVGQSRSIRSLTKQDLMATHSNSSKSLTVHDPASIKSKSSSINIEQKTEPLHLRSRPKSEKLYAPMNLHSNASKVRPISANVLYPLASHIPQQTGAMKLPPITSMCSMTARPVSAKQPTSKSEVFLPASQPDIGKKFAPQSRPSSGKQFAPQSRPSSGKQCAPKSQPSSGKQSTSQSRPVSGSPRPHSATYMQRPGSDKCSPSQYSDGLTCDRADLNVRLSPICVRSDRHGCGEQWTSQPVYEVEVNKCESATDLRVTSPTVGSHQPGFRESGDGPHISAPSPKKACEDPCSSSEALTCSAQRASTTRASSSRHALATCSVEQLTGGPDANKPSWSDGPPKEQAAPPVNEVYPQALTLSADQIGSIRQQLYEEGLKPAERDGGVAFFIPMTVDGLQPQANGVTISDRLTRSRRSSLSYEERLILANINRQAQLHKKKEFALKDIQNVRGAVSNAEIDRSKHEDEIDADLDSSL